MSLFTQTLENLPQTDCERTELKVLTLSAEDFRARTLVARVKELVSMIARGIPREADYGQSTPGSLAKLSQNGSWLKMCADSCQSLLWEE